MAPSDMRLPVTPPSTMPMTATHIASGMASAASTLPRKVPSATNSTSTTKQRALGQVDRDGVQRAIDELGAIVVGDDAHAGRQVALDVVELGLDVLHHLPRVLPDQHHHGAGDDLALAVLGDHAVAQRRPELDRRHLAQQDRRAVVVDGDGGAGDVVEALELRLAAEDHLLVALLDVAAADVAVVLLEHVEDARQRQVIFGEPLGIDDDLVLLGLAAHGVDLDDAGHGAQLPRHVQSSSVRSSIGVWRSLSR